MPKYEPDSDSESDSDSDSDSEDESDDGSDEEDNEDGDDAESGEDDAEEELDEDGNPIPRIKPKRRRLGSATHNDTKAKSPRKKRRKEDANNGVEDRVSEQECVSPY